MSEENKSQFKLLESFPKKRKSCAENANTDTESDSASDEQVCSHGCYRPCYVCHRIKRSDRGGNASQLEHHELNYPYVTSSDCDADKPNASGSGISSKTEDQQREPHFLLVRSPYRKPLLAFEPKSEHTVDRIIGVKQIFPKEEPLFHKCGKQFSLDMVADDELQALIENNPLYQEEISSMKQFFDVLTFKPDLGWIIDAPNAGNVDESEEYNDKVATIRFGFTQSMKSGDGKLSIDAVFEICTDILKDLNIRRADSVRPKLLGDFGSSDSTVYYQEFEDAEFKNNQTAKTAFESSEDKICTTPTKEANPDFMVRYWRRGDWRHVFIAEVKSLEEAKQSPKCPLETWIQALAGLKTHNVTYGILYVPTRAIIYELRKEDKRETAEDAMTLTTTSRSFDFYNEGSDSDKFEVSEFVDFFKHLCCILAADLLNN